MTQEEYDILNAGGSECHYTTIVSLAITEFGTLRSLWNLVWLNSFMQAFPRRRSWCLHTRISSNLSRTSTPFVPRR